MKVWPLLGFSLGLTVLAGLTLCCFLKPSWLGTHGEVQTDIEKRRLKKLGVFFLAMIVFHILFWVWISN
jgi:hypothetical protein